MLYFDAIISRKDIYLDENIKNDKPYDSAFKTVMHECKDIVYPLLNETFGESYDESISIEFLNEEHEDSSDADTKKNVASDTNFIVKDSDGNILGRYVYDCQSTSDNTMTVRMFRYGARTAFENYYIENGVLHMPFPDIAVLYLRGEGNEKIETSTIKVDFPNNTTDYNMKVLRLKRYTVDELFGKKLYVLLPFTLFLYEGELAKTDNDSEKLQQLMNVYHEIISRLENVLAQGNITNYEKNEILYLLRYVSNHLAMKFINIRKGVDDIMGGQLLELDYNKGYHTGEKKGEDKGRTEGENRMGALVNKLVENNMISEITKVTNDPVYRNEMYKKFGI